MIIKPWVVLVGGFLGAGKTTLLIAAARELNRRGLRSAIILNDQGDSLVDTEWTSLQGFRQSEVTGGCFCCRLSKLVEAMDRLRRHSPDVIFAEPVGSCTDISATTLHPLHEYGDIYRVAPYTVLVDPSRAEALVRDDADPDLAFLFRNQIQEADLLCFTKSDIYPDPKVAIVASSVRQISGKTGQGVAAWLDEVLSGHLSSGSVLLDIDYERYAKAEAALAWLNAQASIRPRLSTSPSFVLGPFLESVAADFSAAGIKSVHLKAIARAETGFVKVAISRDGERPSVEGMLAASPADHHDLILNIRAAGPAELVRKIVELNLAALDAAVSDVLISCFHPAPPRPEMRCVKPLV